MPRPSQPKLYTVFGGAVEGPQPEEQRAQLVSNFYPRAGRLVRRKGSAPLYNDTTAGEKELLLWTRLRGQEYLLAVDGDTGNLQDHFQSPPATVTGGGTAFAPYTEVNAGWLDQRLFLGNGTGNLLRFDGTRLVRALPDTPDAGRVNGFWVAGSPPFVVGSDGPYTYRYRFAWVGADGQWSVPTEPTSGIPVATNSSIFLKNLPQPPNTQGIQGLALFRTQADGAVYYYVTMLPSGTTTYTDHTADGDLGALLPLTNDPMPPCRYLATWQERLVGGWTATDASTLFLSNEKEPWFCPELPDTTDPTQGTRISLQDFGGGEITAVGVHGSFLVAFTRTAGYLLTGDHPENFALRQFTHAGCVSHRTLQSTPAGLLWLAPDGVYRWDSQSVERVSDDLYDTFHGKSAAELALGHAVVWDNKYVLSFPASGYVAQVQAGGGGSVQPGPGGSPGASFPRDYLVWFKADAITNLSEGASVLLWPDSSGNGYHSTHSEADASGAPTYHTNQLNGLPIVRSSPTRTNAIPAGTIPKQKNKSWTFFYLGRLNTAQSSNPILTPASNDPGEWSVAFYPYDNNSNTGPPNYATSSWYNNNSGDPFNGSQFGIVTGGVTVWSVRLDKAAPSGASWVNGHALTANPFGVGTYSSSGASLGGSYAITVPGNASADSAEILLYPRALSDAEMSAVNAYLMARGGIT